MFIEKGNVPAEKIEKTVQLRTRLVSEATDEEISIEILIRKRYSMSQELKLHRKKLMGILSDEEWNAYTDYVQECIDNVSEVEE